ncbi:MAG: glycosyltransferase family 4 protein, partial [Leptospiraceae bacterium]|nr:glycosyltransferase family 4 protein [Leptospiraceae bacterium]
LRFGSHSNLFSEKFIHQGFNLERELRLLFFGRILNYKGIDVLIRAYDLMVKKGMNVELTVAGEGRIEDWILREIKRLNINLINRWITEDELLEILKGTDIVVAPYKEASQSGPVSIATALGIPVIATKVGGLVEQVLDGINGILIEPEDPETLCKAVERVYYDRNLLIKLSEGAKFLSRSQLSWDNIVKEMEEIWE